MHEEKSRYADLVLAEQARLLSEIAEISCTDSKAAISMLATLASPESIDSRLSFLRLAVLEMASRHNSAADYSEFDLHRHFWKNLDRYLPGSQKEECVSNGKDIPDGWVRVNGEVLPVEMKLGRFTVANSRQLDRYIETYKSKRGVAVAQEFPKEISSRFICIQHCF